MEPEHAEICEGLYRASQRVRGFNGPIDKQRAIEVGDVWSAALKRIPADRLRAAFETALGKYTDTSVPFGAPQILDAWAEMTGGKDWTEDPLLAEKPHGWGCSNEAGHSYAPDGFEIDGWKYLRCAHCGHQAVARKGN